MSVIESTELELGDREPELQTEIAALRAGVTLFDPAGVRDFDERRQVYVKLAQADYWASHAIAALLAVQAAHQGSPREAIAFAERALENGRLLSERGAGGWTPPHAVGALIEAEAFDRALAALDSVDAAARASGAALGQFTSIAFRGWANARRGDLAAAEANLLATLSFAEEMGMLMGITTTAFFLSDVLVERENLAHVCELLEQIQLPPDFLKTVSGAMLLEVRGRLRLLRRDHRGGIEDLRAAGRTNTALRFGPTYSTWRSSLALAMPAEESVQARALVDEELKLARATGLARPVGIALRSAGILAEPNAGIALLQQSVEVLEDSPARLEHARSLIELGSALRRANRRRDARPPLTTGLELARECGAERLSKHAEHELLGAGGRSRRIATGGRDALTASELRVVRLAAAGATNTEIARELYVSLKTVETHLAHAYDKLSLAGRGSRGRLAAILEEATV